MQFTLMLLKLKKVKHLIIVIRNKISKQSQLISVLAIRKAFDAVAASFSSKFGYKLEESKAAVIPGVENNFRRRIRKAFCASPRRSLETADLNF